LGTARPCKFLGRRKGANHEFVKSYQFHKLVATRIEIFTNAAVGVNTNDWGKHQLGITPTIFVKSRG
jgi:hypothetical protein